MFDMLLLFVWYIPMLTVVALGVVVWQLLQRLSGKTRTSHSMETHTERAAPIVLAALGGGVVVALAWEWLHRGTGVGAGWTVFVLLATGVLVTFLFWSRRVTNWWSLWFLVPIALLALDAMVYENPVVNFFAPVATVILLASFGVFVVSPAIPFRSVGFLTPIEAIGDWLRSVSGIAWIGRTLTGRGNRSTLREATVGVLLALPFLLIFLALFANADVLVLRAIRQIVQMDTVSLIIRRSIFGIIVAGYLAALASVVRVPRAPRTTQSATTGGTVAGFFFALDVLFVVFLLIQAVELFGGQAFRASHGITYAEYARSGFFELLAAAGLATALVLAWFPRIVDAGVGRRARAAAFGFLIGTGLVAASSVWRIILYARVYGLTLSRTYAFIVVVTIVIGLSMLWLALRGRRDRAWLHHSLSVLAIAVFTMTMTLPIERIVAEWNVQRYIRGERKEFDLRYITEWMSADAWSAVVRIALQNQDAKEFLEQASCTFDGSESSTSQPRSRADTQSSYRGNFGLALYRDRHWQSTNILEALWCSRLPAVQAELRRLR